MSELARRIAFAVVAIPVTIMIVYFGDAALATLLAIAAALGAWELCRIARAGGSTPMMPAAVVLAAAIPLAVHAQRLGVFRISPAVAAVVLLAMFTAVIWTRGVPGRPLGAVAITLFAALYTGGMLAFGYSLRYHRFTITAVAGTVLVLLPVILTWAQDTWAYAVGRTMGRNKLIPAVSPGKTVEGAIGGIVVTVLVCWLYVHFLLIPHAQLALSTTGIIVFGIAVSIAAQVGDLAESLIKREAGVKDSSTIIPGHGGILDRFDSLFFVLPVAYLLLNALLLPAPVAR